MNATLLKILVLYSFHFATLGQNGLLNTLQKSETIFKKHFNYLSVRENASYFNLNEVLFENAYSSEYHDNTKLVKTKQLLSNSKKDLGINLTMLAHFNGNDDVELLNNNFIDGWRYKMGLEWNLLKNGFIQNKKKSKIYTNQIKILESEKSILNNNLVGLETQLKLEKILNSELKYKLERRQEFLNDYYDILIDLYGEKLISRYELLEISNEIYTSQSIIKNLKVDTTLNTFETLPFYIVENIKSPEKNKEIEEAILSNVKLKEHWINNIRAKIYTNYNQTQANNTVSSSNSFVDYGLRITVPLGGYTSKSWIEKLQKSELLEFNNDIDIQKRESQSIEKIYEQNLLEYHNLEGEKCVLEEKRRQLEILKDYKPENQTGVDLLKLMFALYNYEIEKIKLKYKWFDTILELFKNGSKFELKPLLSDSKQRCSIGQEYENILFDINNTLEFSFLKELLILKQVKRVFFTEDYPNLKIELKEIGIEYIRITTKDEVLAKLYSLSKILQEEKLTNQN